MTIASFLASVPTAIVSSLVGDSFFRLPRFNARRGGGFVREMIRWFIMVAIYDICIGTIAEVLGVSRMVAVFIFLGILGAISLVGYIFRQKWAPGVED